MISRMKTALITLTVIAALPATGLCAEVYDGEEFPATNESLAVIHQFDHDYDKMKVSTASAPAASGDQVKVVIHKASQSMTVSVNGSTDFTTMVSTGMAGKATPSGTFKPHSVEAVHESKEFHAPLPWAVNITGGYYIHGATEGAIAWMEKKIPHSHGCVRVPPVYARKLYDLVREAGLRNTTIVVTN